MSRHSRFIIDDPVGLSTLAAEFLRENGGRIEYDMGPSRQQLETDLAGLAGLGVFLDFLEAIQERYGGLTYQSGYFREKIVFEPSCQPDLDPGEALEISYAVVTGTTTGASVDSSGTVIVGMSDEVAEFRSLDQLVEFDGHYWFSRRLGIFEQIYVGGAAASEQDLSSRLARVFPDIRLIDAASGNCSYTYLAPSLVVQVTTVWTKVGGIMPPIAYIGAGSRDDLDAAKVALRE